MKQSRRTFAALISLLLVCSGTLSHAARSSSGKGAERSVTVTASDPCGVARSTVEGLGLLAPQIRMLPNSHSFGAANGELKTVVACKLSDEEAYTYERLLSFSGIALLSFKGEESPQQVVEALARQLGLPVQKGDSGSAPSYLFPAQGAKGQLVRLSLKPARTELAALVRSIADSAAAKEAVSDAPALPVAAPSAAGVAPAENEARLGIWDLYQVARGGDPDIGRSQARVAGSKADSDIVFAGLLPHVNANAGMSFIDQTLINYAPEQQHSSVVGHNYDVSAQMPILHVPTLFNLSAAAASERSEDAALSASRQNLMVRFLDAYFGVMKSQVDREVAREEIARVKQVLDQAQAFLKAGTGDVIAVYEAQARLDGVMAELNRTESSVRLSEQRLAAVVGKEVGAVTAYQQPRPRGPEPEDLEWWVRAMEKSDPQVRQAREGLAQSKELKKAAKAERLPMLHASTGYNVNQGAAFLPNVETRQWSIAATLTLPLYSGGETSARIRRAAATEAERGFQLDQVLDQRRDNLRQAYFNLTYNVSLINALERKKKSAEVQLDAVKKGRSIGTRTAIDLLNAEEAFSVAQRDLKNALYDNVVRVVQLKAAAGVLAEGDIQEIALAGERR